MPSKSELQRFAHWLNAAQMRQMMERRLRAGMDSSGPLELKEPVDLADQEWEKTDWTRQQAEQVLGSIDTKLMDAGAVETREERTLAPSGVAGFQKPLQTEKTKAVSSKFAAEAFFRCPNVNKSLTTFPPYLVRSVELQTSCFWDGIYPITASKSETDTGALSAPNTAIFGGDVTTLDRNHLFDQGSLICWRDLILGRQRKYSIGNDSTL